MLADVWAKAMTCYNEGRWLYLDQAAAVGFGIQGLGRLGVNGVRVLGGWGPGQLCRSRGNKLPCNKEGWFPAICA